jgi:hypothetical protein
MSGMSCASSSSTFAPLSDMSISVQFRNGRPSPTLIQAIRSTLLRLPWRIRKVILNPINNHRRATISLVLPTPPLDCKQSYPWGRCEDGNRHSVFRPKFEVTFENNLAFHARRLKVARASCVLRDHKAGMSAAQIADKESNCLVPNCDRDVGHWP